MCLYSPQGVYYTELKKAIYAHNISIHTLPCYVMQHTQSRNSNGVGVHVLVIYACD